jgi:hypothetical protein
MSATQGLAAPGHPECDRQSNSAGSMFKFSTRIRIIPRLRAGLRIQIALLGISGVLLTGAICLAGLNLAASA